MKISEVIYKLARVRLRASTQYSPNLLMSALLFSVHAAR